MKLIALALGLILEHIATEALHLRELRWFDRYFDFAVARVSKLRGWTAYLGVVGIVAVPALPVLVISLMLQGPEILWDLAYLSFAVLVVFLCLGPRDLGSEVDEYCAALDQGDSETADRVLREMAETSRPGSSDIEAVEEAVFVQANNRVFGVVFWFILLGPVGAWFFRVSDLLRRRVAFETERASMPDPEIRAVVEAVYGVLKWAPARLAMLGYALSGSFDDAMNRWRAFDASPDAPIDRRNDEIVAAVGRAAMTGFLDEPTNSSAAARNAFRLVSRTLFIWVSAIALMTVFGWAL